MSVRRIDCNLVLKGGVTSGLVYAGAFPGLAARYRFAAVAGSSAGAIAAAFAAAAEFARSRGDPQGFARLEACCEELPQRLLGLFQPSPPFRRLMRALVLLAPGTGKARWLSAVAVFWPVLAAGGLAGGLLGAWLAGWPAADGLSPRPLVAITLSGFAGAVAVLAVYLIWLVGHEAPRRGFGLCSGLSQGDGPALTEWLHASLQTIAFGDDPPERPLTFGDLAACDPPIDLRIVVTNLSHATSEVAPDLGPAIGFRRAAWARLFPAVVLDHLAETGFGQDGGAALPVLAAVRMSLSCPALMELVPMVDAQGQDLWFADGGLTTNFPFEIFEAEPPDAPSGRPTLALDFDTVDHRDAAGPRIRHLDPGADHDRPRPLGGLRGFAWALVVALREGRLRKAARRGERRTRLYQVRLTADEGGMNLAMTQAQARRLIDYGRALADFIVAAETGERP